MTSSIDPMGLTLSVLSHTTLTRATKGISMKVFLKLPNKIPAEQLLSPKTQSKIHLLCKMLTIPSALGQVAPRGQRLVYVAWAAGGGDTCSGSEWMTGIASPHSMVLFSTENTLVRTVVVN